MDNQLLQGKTKVCYFNKIKRSFGRECGLQGCGVGITAADLLECGAGLVRPRVDLTGEISLPGAVIPQYQYRAVALGNPGDRPLNPSFGRRSGSRRPVFILDDCNSSHKKTMVYFIFSNAGSKLRGVLNKKWVSLAV
jgi:hypothetical protein